MIHIIAEPLTWRKRVCYSALIEASYSKLVRAYGAVMSLEDFTRLYMDGHAKTPKAMDDGFSVAKSQLGVEIWHAIQQHRAAESSTLEQELFALKQRQVTAERSLQSKVTKKAQSDLRIASNKIERVRQKLSDLSRTEHKDRDSRIFPGFYAPVIISEGGQRKIVPMRYQCRLAGKPASYDKRYPGTYNARRDSLEGFWAPAFGRSHGIMVVHTFYENVEGPDGKNQVIQFTPKTGEPMLVACLWSRWTDPEGLEPDLLSFAAITDEPEPEVAEAGHDRTIINIKPEHLDAWLNPDPSDLAALYRIFDDKRHPYYEHRLAA